MATLAVYPEWYDRSGGIVQRQDITEVAVVDSYTPNGNEVASWNAASEGSIMCHIVGTKLIVVWGGLTAIPDKMFTFFISLEKITGLSAVTTIGVRAFYRCHSLVSVDLIPENLTNIGNDAFRISNMEDVLDISKLSAECEVGARATRSQRWGAELANVQAVAFPQKRIYLEVPNPDCQVKDVYKEVPFVTDEATGEVIHTFYDGCTRFSLYHAWNALYAGTDKEYPDFLSWFNATLNKNGDYAENTHSIDGTPLFRDYATLGWGNEWVENVTASTQLVYILDELSCGFPVSVGIKTGTAYHAVLIVGCDPNTRKLAFVDSGAREDKGVVLWSAYEDLFIGGSTDGVDELERIYKIDFKPPMLAAGCTWFTQGGTTVKRATITEIEIVRSYTPTGNETASWDASAELDGSVMAYVNGTKLTIAGNGYYAIWANSNSSWVFSDSAKKDYFSKVAVFNGLSLLNTSNATTMERMFRQCGTSDGSKALNLDVANWNTANVTNMLCTFDRCTIKALPIDDWDVSSVTNFSGFLQSCFFLGELNLSKWVMQNEANTSLMFYSNRRLKKITLSEGFVVANDAGTETFSSTEDEYIPYADGNWYDYGYNAYAPAEIPSNVARTYYASKFIAADDDDTMVFVRNGTLRKMAVAIRHKNGRNDRLFPSEFAEAVLELE